MPWAKWRGTVPDVARWLTKDRGPADPDTPPVLKLLSGPPACGMALIALAFDLPTPRDPAQG
jgi:hypothetical protein